jgi:hypothetical protein
MRLEVVDRGAVGKKQHRVEQVLAPVRLGIASEEAPHLRPREIFERHGVDLGRFVGRHEVVDGALLAAAPILEGMAELVHERPHVGAAAVEVGEHERHAARREVRAIRPEGFARAPFDVEQVALQHHFDEFAERGIDRRERFARPREDPSPVAERDDALLHAQRSFVPEVNALQTARATDPAHELVREGNDDPRDFVPIARHVGRAVVDAAHAPVAQRQIVLVAELARHPVAQAHELVEDPVEPLAAFLEDAPARLFGRVARRPIGILQ